MTFIENADHYHEIVNLHQMLSDVKDNSFSFNVLAPFKFFIISSLVYPFWIQERQPIQMWAHKITRPYVNILPHEVFMNMPFVVYKFMNPSLISRILKLAGNKHGAWRSVTDRPIHISATSGKHSELEQITIILQKCKNPFTIHILSVFRIFLSWLIFLLCKFLHVFEHLKCFRLATQFTCQPFEWSCCWLREKVENDRLMLEFVIVYIRRWVWLPNLVG